MPALLLALCLLFSLPARAAVVDGVVAAIDYEIVALSTLEAYRQSYAPELTLESALQQLIDERVLAREAARYGRKAHPKALEEAEASHPRPQGLSPSEWAALVGDHLLAQDFLDFRFSGSVPISREELRAFYEGHRDRFPQPFEAAEPALRRELGPLWRAQRQRAYLDELRVRADVTIEADLLPVEE